MKLKPETPGIEVTETEWAEFPVNGPKKRPNKYRRVIIGGLADRAIDVYSVLLTFNVTDPAVSHAVKKLLCAGLRNKGSRLQDLKESLQAIGRAIEIEEQSG